MLFSSPLFLFLFLPGLLLCYFGLGRRFPNAVLLVCSLFFYGWGEPRFVFVALASAVLDWLLGAAIYRAPTVGGARAYMALGVILNVALLVYFKYVGFGINTLDRILTATHHVPLPVPRIALPIGVSFIVFEKITYLVDIYRKIGKPSGSLPTYLLYVFFFPKLLAGPIIKYHDIAAQLSDHRSTFDDVIAGAIRFVIGLAKKVWIADTMGEAVEAIFHLPPDHLGTRCAWLGVLCFAVQIYFDFSGYSDMAIGMARILGFRLLENFNSPYIATSFTDFWRRWHISLSTWIREYLYIPLGGNRVSAARTYANLWLCFLLSGLWHGARWNFVLWGAYHGLFLVLDKLFWLRVQRRLHMALNRALTFLLILIGWVLFRAENLRQIGAYLSTMADLPSLVGKDSHSGRYIYFTNDLYLFLLLGLALSFAPVLWQNLSGTEAPGGIAMAARQKAAHQTVTRMVASLVLLILCLAKIADATFNPFLYFRF